MGTRKAAQVRFPFSSGMALPAALAAPVEVGMCPGQRLDHPATGFQRGHPWPSGWQWWDCGYESLRDGNMVTDELGWWSKQLEALLTILREVSFFSSQT